MWIKRQEFAIGHQETMELDGTATEAPPSSCSSSSSSIFLFEMLSRVSQRMRISNEIQREGKGGVVKTCVYPNGNVLTLNESEQLNTHLIEFFPPNAKKKATQTELMKRQTDTLTHAQKHTDRPIDRNKKSRWRMLLRKHSALNLNHFV